MPVTVTANASGEVIRPTKNPLLSQVRVEETRVSYENGFRNSTKRSALITGPTEEMTAEFYAGKVMVGQVRVIESLEPTRKDNITKDLKIAGKTGIVCTFDDQPIYRTTEFTADLDAKDILIAHNNADIIKSETNRLKLVATEFEIVDDLEEEFEEADPIAA